MKNNERKIRQGSDAIEEIRKLLPKVLNKMFPVPVEMLKWDKGFWFDPKEVEQEEGGKYRDIFLFPQTCPVSEEDLIDHFLQKTISEYLEKDSVKPWISHIFEDKDKVLGWKGELFFELNDRETNHVKSFCLRSYGDEDREEIDNTLLPVLDNYSVDYVIHRLEKELRLWIFCDTSVWLLASFIEKILEEADIVSSLGLVLSPIDDLAVVPIPGGYSLHNDSAGLVEFRGEIGNDPIFIINAILQCKPVSEMQMLAILQQPSNESLKKN